MDWDKFDLIVFGFMIIAFIVLVIGMIFFMIHSIGGNFHTSDNVVECNDRDGDVIRGDITCYDKIFCSNNLKSMNPNGCEEFIG